MSTTIIHGGREFRLILCDKPGSYTANVCDTPDAIHSYLRDKTASSPYWTADRENFGIVHLSCRRRPIAMEIIATGILDSVLVHAREVFRSAILNGAHAIALFHNHPAGDPTPSEADIRTTRDIIRGGQLLKIEVVDHIILGRELDDPFASSMRQRGYASMRELGHFIY